MNINNFVVVVDEHLFELYLRNRQNEYEKCFITFLHPYPKKSNFLDQNLYKNFGLEQY